MDREKLDSLLSELKKSVESSSAGHLFPLNAAVVGVATQRDARRSLDARISERELDLLALFDVTSVSASLAVKSVSRTHSDTTGITTALVDLWGQAEAARCLWLDQHSLFSGEAAKARGEALQETARLLAPEAISLAIRLGEPVVQYVEFVSKLAT